MPPRFNWIYSNTRLTHKYLQKSWKYLYKGPEIKNLSEKHSSSSLRNYANIVIIFISVMFICLCMIQCYQVIIVERFEYVGLSFPMRKGRKIASCLLDGNNNFLSRNYKCCHRIHILFMHALTMTIRKCIISWFRAETWIYFNRSYGIVKNHILDKSIFAFIPKYATIKTTFTLLIWVFVPEGKYFLIILG